MVALAIDAVFRLGRSGGYRVLPAQVFFSGPNRTVAAGEEMVTHLHLKAFPDRTGSVISDVALRQNSRALAVGGGGDAPRRCAMVETNLIGSSITDAPGMADAGLRAHLPQKGKGVLDAKYEVAVLPVLLRDTVRDACAAALTG